MRHTYTQNDFYLCSEIQIKLDILYFYRIFAKSGNATFGMLLGPALSPTSYPSPL